MYPHSVLAVEFGITPPAFVKPPLSGHPDIAIGNTINFITTILAIIGVVASIIWLIYGGIRYITSAGDKAAIEGAKTHIVSALVGLIIVLFSFVIISLVFTLLGLPGLSNTTFTIPRISHECTACSADVNRDGVVNGADVSSLVPCWGKSSSEIGSNGKPCSPFDVNGDGIINDPDIDCIKSQDLKVC